MPQRQKTAPIEATDLPDISAEDQEFARLVALGKMSLTDAYRATHDCAAWSSPSVHAQASRHRSNPKIQSWIDAFRTAGVGASSVTFERHVAELERLKALCVTSGNMGAAVQCETVIGKAAGLHVEQIRDVTNIDTVATLKEIAQTSPDLAAALAAQHGIEWSTPADATKH